MNKWVELTLVWALGPFAEKRSDGAHNVRLVGTVHRLQCAWKAEFAIRAKALLFIYR